MEIRYTWVKMQQFYGNQAASERKIFQIIKISDSGEAGGRIKTELVPDSPVQQYSFLTEKEAIALVRILNTQSKFE